MLLNTVTSTVHFIGQVKSQGNCDDGEPVKLLRKEHRNGSENDSHFCSLQYPGKMT